MFDVPRTSAKPASLWKSWRDLNRALFRLDAERAIDLLNPGNRSKRATMLVVLSIVAQSIAVVWLEGVVQMITTQVPETTLVLFVGPPVTLLFQTFTVVYTTAWIYFLF